MLRSLGIGSNSGRWHNRPRQTEYLGGRSAQVVPAGRTFQQDEHPGILSFLDAFDFWGVPVVLILGTCIVWTTWLIIIAIAPNQSANWLMNTSMYDNGDFWLIVDKHPGITLACAGSLALVDLCYLVVLVKMLRWHQRVADVELSQRVRSQARRSTSSAALSRPKLLAAAGAYRRCDVYKNISTFTGRKRNFWVRWTFPLAHAVDRVHTTECRWENL